MGQALLAQYAEDAPECRRTSRAAALPHLREADVMWARRVWREIDLREKINLPLYVPQGEVHGCISLFDVLCRALLTEGRITAYHPGPLLQDDSFSRPLVAQEVDSILMHQDTVRTENITTGELVPVVQEVRVMASEVTRYRIKEDWIFDRQRSVMDVRIIGLAPMREVRGEDGELLGHAPLFWLHYPECRQLLAEWLAPYPGNDAVRPSFDDIFQHRMFNSLVVKVSNVHDRGIGDHLSGVDALEEAARCEQDLLQWEQDMWAY
jgi:gliding motility associated protien GldN